MFHSREVNLESSLWLFYWCLRLSSIVDTQQMIIRDMIQSRGTTHGKGGSPIAKPKCGCAPFDLTHHLPLKTRQCKEYLANLFG